MEYNKLSSPCRPAQGGRMLCSWMVSYCITKSLCIVSSQAYLPGPFLFPQSIFLSHFSVSHPFPCLFVKLFLYLILQVWKPHFFLFIFFFLQSFLDSHLLNAFYSSVIDFFSQSWFLSFTVSFLPRGLVLSLTSSVQVSLHPLHIQHKCLFLLASTFIFVFRLSPSS